MKYAASMMKATIFNFSSNIHEFMMRLIQKTKCHPNMLLILSRAI